MRIFYVNVIEQNAGWGAETFVNRALIALGHSTYCLDFRQKHHRLYQPFLKAPESDVFFLQRGDFFPIPLIKSIQVPRFFWASELVSRCRDQDRLLKSGLFEHIFLHTGDCLETVVARGWVDRKKCSVLLNGFDETVHRFIPGTRRDIDVLFIGSLTERRKQIFSQIKSRFNLVVTSAFAEEQVQLFNRAKIVLNFHSEDFLDTETRIFEVLGSGAFLLSERLSRENPFSPNELVQFDTIDDLCDKVKYFLANDEARNKVAEAGHSKALSRHTYAQRAKEIIDVMSSYLPPSGSPAKTMLRRDWRLGTYGAGNQFYASSIVLLGRQRHHFQRQKAKLKAESGI